MKRLTILATLALGLGLTRTATAATTDSLTVTITPNAYYSVTIDTTGVSLDLGSVALNTTTGTVSPALVTIQSTYATTDLKLQGSITSAGPTPWTFSNNTTRIENDKIAAWAVFTDTSVAVVPTSAGAFSGTEPVADSDLIGAGNPDVGDGGNTAHFVVAAGEAGYKTMEDMPNFAVDPAASHSNLWLKYRLPGSSTRSEAQFITHTLTAGAPN